MERERFDIMLLTRQLFSYSLEDNYKEKIYKYINILSDKELKMFNKYAKDFVYNKKYLGCKNIKITTNAVKLCEKIYKGLDIKVFPYICKIAHKGYSVGDGTYAWGMYELSEYRKLLYSNFKVKICLKRNMSFNFDTDGIDFELNLIENNES